MFWIILWAQVNLPSKHTKIMHVVSVMGLPPKHLHNKRLENVPHFLYLDYVRARWQVARSVATMCNYSCLSIIITSCIA